MKKQFSIFLLVFFMSANINAEISSVNIGNLSQLYKGQITKILVGNKLFGHYDDGVYRGPVEEIHYKNGVLMKEIWYNEDGSLMNANQIIKKGGTSPVGTKGIRFNLGDVHWERESVIVNDIGFSRTLAGHTYKIIEL